MVKKSNKNHPKIKDVGFIGLGKLGLPVALAIESKGFNILGFDIDPRIKGYIKNKKIPFQEVGVNPLLKKTEIQIMDSLEDVVKKSDIVFCAIQTPHNPLYEGDKPLPTTREDFDYSYLIKAVKDIVAIDEYVNLIVLSTCLPGTFKKRIKPLLTEKINYFYNPLFIAMGTVIPDFLSPEFVLIGGKDPHLLKNFYSRILGSDRSKVTDITTAEGIKVFYNSFVTTKTVLGNMYGEFAHKLGMNVDHIYETLSDATDRLISPRYLKSGVADGGACHPRDNIALSYLANKIGMSFNYFDALIQAREDHMKWLAGIFTKQIRSSGLPGIILGKSFKPKTKIQTGSAAILLSNILKRQKVKFKHFEFDYPKRLAKAVYFIATQHNKYKKLRFPKGSIVIDPFRYIPIHKGVETIEIGKT